MGWATRRRGVVVFTLAALVRFAPVVGSMTTAQLPVEPGILSVTVEVELSCPSCAQGLERRLRRLENVDQVEILADDGRVVLTPEPGSVVDVDSVREVIRNAGFIPTDVALTLAGQVTLAGDTPALLLPGDRIITLVSDDRTAALVAQARDRTVRVRGHLSPNETGGPDALAIDAFEIP